MTRDPAVYIQDILDSISTIEEATKGLTEREFISYAERIVQQAVIRNLEIIGEASRQLPQEFKSLHSYIPWAKMIAMRNILIHEYFGVKLSSTWEVVQRDLPLLKEQLEKLL